jgi:putative membrane protein
MEQSPGMSIEDLPLVNACLNGLSAVFLASGYLAIKAGREKCHRNFMMAALVTSVVFLACYLTYHFNVQVVTRFREPAWFRPFYLAILISHTVLAMVVVPLVLTAVWKAIRGRFEQHKRWARWAWPIWMYVSVTGVIIYLLLYRIFPQARG